MHACMIDTCECDSDSELIIRYMEVPNWKILISIYGEAHIRGLLTCDLL